MTTKTLRRRFFSLAGRLISAPTHPAPATTLALGKPVQSQGETARPPTPFLTAPDPSARLSTGLAVPRQAGTSVSTAAICPADLPLRNHLRSSTTSVRGAHSPHPAESLRIKALQPLSRTSHPCLGRRDCIASVDSGLAEAGRNDLVVGQQAQNALEHGMKALIDAAGESIPTLTTSATCWVPSGTLTTKCASSASPFHPTSTRSTRIKLSAGQDANQN